jgi:peptide/nickel transport system permease protein
MVAFLIRRALSLIPVLIGISILAYFLGAAAPGDPATSQYILANGFPPENEEVLIEVREQMGLNDPLPVQYARWLGGVTRGDLGKSYKSGAPVVEELAQRLPVTLRLAVIGLLGGMLLALPLGVLSAVYHNRPIDLLARLFSMIGSAMPSFWLAYILILLFSVRLRFLPVAGSGTWKHFILPAMVLSTFGAASMSRLVRSSLLEVLGADYIRAARAKGVRDRWVVLKHALRNALIPVVTHMGTLFGYLVAGSVIVETVFAISGLGRLIVEAISFRDYPVIQGFVLFTGVVFMLINLLVDLSYSLIDPRVRLTSVGESSV